MKNTKTPLADSLERDRIALGQARTPAYGDALRLLKQTETALKVMQINLQNREAELRRVFEIYEYFRRGWDRGQMGERLRAELRAIEETLK